jgi:hypothetical protein
MMEKVEWYCFVSLFRELILLLHIELDKQCGKTSTGLSNVLKSHRSQDKAMLSFLYKPNDKTFKFFLKYRFEMKWPQVNLFLQSRGLVVDNFRSDYLKENVFQIVNADAKSIRLSLHDCFFFFCVRANEKTEGRKTYFKIECREYGDVNIRCSQYDRHLISRHAWTRADKDIPGSNNENVDWLLVKVEREDKSDCFVIVAKSTENSCLYYDNTGRVHDKAYNPSDNRCFWRLHPVNASLFNRI